MIEKVIISCLILFLCSLCFGKPTLAVSEKTRNYLNSRNLYDSKRMNEKSVTNLKKGYSYVLTVEESTHKTINKMKNYFSKDYEVQEIGLKKIRIKKDNVKLDLTEKDSNRPLCGMRMLKKMMPVGDSDKFMLVSVDTERSFSVSQGVKVEGYRFNFSRLFNNRVVRSKDDFLMIRTDEQGMLKDVRMSLQDLKETSEYIETNEDYSENEKTLDSLLNENFNEVEFFDQKGFGKKERIEEIEIRSAAEAYCEVLVGTAKKLFPCLSYTSKIKLSNNEKMSYIIDAPHSRKSWSNYKHEKNGSVRFNRYDR